VKSRFFIDPVTVRIPVPLTRFTETAFASVTAPHDTVRLAVAVVVSMAGVPVTLYVVAPVNMTVTPVPVSVGRFVPYATTPVKPVNVHAAAVAPVPIVTVTAPERAVIRTLSEDVGALAPDPPPSEADQIAVLLASQVPVATR
jgi:hypothetical protein